MRSNHSLTCILASLARESSWGRKRRLTSSEPRTHYLSLNECVLDPCVCRWRAERAGAGTTTRDLWWRCKRCMRGRTSACPFCSARLSRSRRSSRRPTAWPSTCCAGAARLPLRLHVCVCPADGATIWRPMLLNRRANLRFQHRPSSPSIWKLAHLLRSLSSQRVCLERSHRVDPCCGAWTPRVVWRCT